VGSLKSAFRHEKQWVSTLSAKNSKNSGCPRFLSLRISELLLAELEVMLEDRLAYDGAKSWPVPRDTPQRSTEGNNSPIREIYLWLEW
jgi:hypothetical protein